MTEFQATLARERGGRSRAEFARALGLSYTFVREMEQGRRFPSDVTLVAIADKLGQDVGELTLAVYGARSELLRRVLAQRGVLETAPGSPALNGSTR